MMLRRRTWVRAAGSSPKGLAGLDGTWSRLRTRQLRQGAGWISTTSYSSQACHAVAGVSDSVSVGGCDRRTRPGN